ncbi:MAG: lysylphosphatidylglycerol synthase transmembrane domain-containing protein [Gammaproteobacteria bacterium]|nr:lysylphosphatidylglycerol synthase transmembrane domain-containing protein [Gammaproteobacteria bacterium]
MTVTRDPAMQLSGGRRRTMIAVAGLGVVAYLIAALTTDADSLKAALAALGLTGSLLVLGASLLNYGLRFRRWSLYITQLGHRPPLGRHLLYYLSGFAFTVSPAKIGEAVRALYLREHGVPYADSMAALSVERLLDLLAVALLACLFVLQAPAYWPVLAGALLLTAVLIMVIGRPAASRLLDRLAAARSGRIGAGIASSIADLLRASRRLLSPGLLARGLLLGVIAWGAEGIGLYWICSGLDLAIAPSTAIGIYAIAVLAGAAAFFMPGGLGAMEMMMPALLLAQGVPLPTAVLAMLLCRLTTLWFAVLLGLLAAALLEANPRFAATTSTP